MNCTPLRPLLLPELPFSAPISTLALRTLIAVPAALVTVLPETVGTPTGDVTLMPSPVVRSTVLLVIEVLVWAGLKIPVDA